MLDQNSSEEQLKSARQESERLRAENARLRAMLGTPDSAAEGNNPPEICLMKTPDSRAAEALTQERKVALFRSLFRGREDVYATRWERKDGQSGYSPAGVMDWRAIHAARPEERKKVARKTRVLHREHLKSRPSVGQLWAIYGREEGAVGIEETPLISKMFGALWELVRF